MNGIFVSIVFSMAFSVILAISEKNVIVSNDAIKITDWMQGWGNIASVALSLIALFFAIKAAKNTEKISINQNLNTLSQHFSEKINRAIEELSEQDRYDLDIVPISKFITWCTKGRQAVESMSGFPQNRSVYKILEVYCNTDAILEIRDWNLFYEKLNYTVRKDKENFFSGGDYILYKSIYLQYEGMREAFFRDIPEDVKITNVKKLLSQDIMLKKFKNEKAAEEEKNAASFAGFLREKYQQSKDT